MKQNIFQSSGFSLKQSFIATLQKVKRYNLVLFIVFVSLLYGFLLFKINGFSSAQPTDEQITEKVQSTQTIHIDEAAIRQLESLQDNSVNVQTLFDEARNNPFKE